MSRRVSQVLASCAVVAAFLCAHLLAGASNAQRDSWPIEENYVTLPPPETARLLSVGYNELAADITWVRTLVYYGSGFLGEGDFRYLHKFVYNVIALDPKFKKPYEWAANSITVTPDHRLSNDERDLLASIDILERGMKQFPNDYDLFWTAGYRYYFELKSDDPETQRMYKEKGADLFDLATEKPNAPKDLAARAAGLRTKLGQVEQARVNLMQKVLTTDDKEAQQEMLAKFGGISEQGVAEELQEAVEQFQDLHVQFAPRIAPELFVLLGGPTPPTRIDFEGLATDKDLFGSHSDDDGPELFPR